MAKETDTPKSDAPAKENAILEGQGGGTTEQARAQTTPAPAAKTPPPYNLELTPERALATIGDTIRKAREIRSISLADMAEMTCINRSVLARIEEGNLENLPHLTFVRGFIRNCFEVLEIAEKNFSQELQTLGGARNAYQQIALEKANYAWNSTLFEKETNNHALLIKIACYTGITVAGLWIGYLLYTSTTNQTQAPAQATTSSPDTSNNPESSPKPAGAGDAAATNTQHPLPALVVDGLVLQVQSRERTWLRLSIDGALPVDVLIQKNYQAIWRAKSEFHLTVGNTANIDMALNGEPVPLRKDTKNLSADLILNHTTLRRLEN